MRRLNPIEPLPVVLIVVAAGGAAWYVSDWYRKKNAPPPSLGPGTGDLCSPGTVMATIGISAGSGAAAGAAAGAPAYGVGAIVGAVVGGIAGTFAGLGKVLAAQQRCDQAVCGNLQAAYSDVLARGQGGGRIAKLVRLVHKARRRGETCQGLTDTAGRVVGA